MAPTLTKMHHPQAKLIIMSPSLIMLPIRGFVYGLT